MGFIKPNNNSGGGGGGLTPQELSRLNNAYTHSKSEHAPTTAEENVQADWNETDTTSDAYIKNKPDLSQIGSGGNIPSVTQIEPQELDMPKVFFYGNALPTTKDNVNLTMDYISNTAKFSSFVKLKCQGTSSMSYAKKNFTVSMFSDEARATKLKKDFKGWGAQSKFCLKANYVDTTHTRNISGARIAYDMVASRPDSEFKQQLLQCPRNGAVDGFPIKLYFNGEFYGIYTWNIPKDGWMFNMDKGNVNHMVLCAEKNNDSTNISDDILRCEFRKEWDGTDGNSWSIEFGTYSDALKNSFNRCVNFVMTATDEEFKANIGNYFDLYSLLDYYCFSYLVAHIDGLAKNMLMATYDGVIWGATLYDMDSIYGADWQGTQFKATNIQCPEQYQDTNSLLWQRIESCFSAELYARYLELRQGALSLSNIIKHVEEIYDAIPDRVFADEKAKWTSLPGVNTNTMTRFRNYMRDRAKYVDAQMEEIRTKVPCTGIVLSADTLSFTTTDTQTLSAVVSPTNCTDKVTWSVFPSGIVTVNNGVVTPIGNGECTITATCGSYSDTCDVTVSGITITETEGVIQTTYTSGYIARCSNHISSGVNYGDLKPSASDITTDFINHTPGNYYVVKQPATQYGCGIVIYDANKEYLGTYVTNGQVWIVKPDSSYKVEFKDTNVTIDNIPKNAAYIRMSFNVTDSSSITINAHSGGTIGEDIVSENLLYGITWSANADNGIYNDASQGTVGVEKGSGNGDAYLSGQIPCSKKKYILSNINGATFIYKEIYVYTSDGTFLGGHYGNGKYNTNGQANETTEPITMDLRNISEEPAYMKITVYPNNVATNNDPANQLKLIAYD